MLNTNGSLKANLVMPLQMAVEQRAEDWTVPGPQPVSPESLELVARRTLPIVSLSPYISRAVEAAAGSSREMRKRSLRLTDKLKLRSRSKARGGLQALETVEGTEKLQGTERKVPLALLKHYYVCVQRC